MTKQKGEHSKTGVETPSQYLQVNLGCKSFHSVGEIWIIKWAVKRVKSDII